LIDEEMKDGVEKQESNAKKVHFRHERPEKRQARHEQNEGMDKDALPVFMLPGQQRIRLEKEISQKMRGEEVCENEEMEHDGTTIT
jgi:hypothetical protein